MTIMVDAACLNGVNGGDRYPLTRPLYNGSDGYHINR